MKKTVLIVALTAAMCAFASCDKETVISSVPSSMSAAVTTEAVSDKAEAATAATAAASAKTETAAASDTTAANTDDIADYSGLAGYWYANGDPNGAFFCFTNDGRFKEYNNYYGGILYSAGNVKIENDTDSSGNAYGLYYDTGELYKKFTDKGEKSDIYFEDGDATHYVKLYNEGEGDFGGKTAEEAYTGSWICGRAIIEISSNGEGSFNAKVSWGASAAAHVIWDYPLVLDNGKLVCSGNGKKTYVEFENAESDPVETIEYTNGSAEFTMAGNHLFWNDLSDHGADDMLFEKNSEAY